MLNTELNSYLNPSNSDLIESYRLTRRRLRQLQDNSEIISDKQTIVGMIRSVSYAIDLMESGCFPRRKRAINRNSYLQRTFIFENRILEDLANRYRKTETSGITQQQARMLDEVLSRLTDRERNCFIAVYGQNLSFSDVADMIGISKSSVATYIRRAHCKIGIKNAATS